MMWFDGEWIPETEAELEEELRLLNDYDEEIERLWAKGDEEFEYERERKHGM